MTYDDLTRRPVVFCFFVGLKDVGVTDRDPPGKFPSPVRVKASGESCLSATSSVDRLLADWDARVVTLAARDCRVRLVDLTGVDVSPSTLRPRTALSLALKLLVTLRASRRRSQDASSPSSGIGG